MGNAESSSDFSFHSSPAHNHGWLTNGTKGQANFRSISLMLGDQIDERFSHIGQPDHRKSVSSAAFTLLTDRLFPFFHHLALNCMRGTQVA